MRYISADKVEEAKEALRHRVPLAAIAGHLRVSESELKRILGVDVAPVAELSDVELWRVEKVNAKL